ncbi:MAG: DUF5615 family PIN-like protein [Candidatus Methylomirabilaceae bacterium]
MRLKLDENVDPRAGPILRTAGHDVATVADERLSGQSDEAVLEVPAAGRRAASSRLILTSPILSRIRRRSPRGLWY